MKLLTFCMHDSWDKTALKSISGAPDFEKDQSVEDAVVIYFHSEADEEAKRAGVMQKIVKNVK